MIKGDNKEDRISNWYEYFCNILEKDSILVDQLLENIDNILTQTEISNEHFTQDEINHAKYNEEGRHIFGSRRILN